MSDLMEKILFGAAGFLMSEGRNWWCRRRGRMQSAAERYLDLLQEGCWTGVALQRCGAAGLSGSRCKMLCEFRGFCRRVEVLGRTDPWQELKLRGLVPLRKMPRFLRTASRRGVQLASDEVVYHFLRDLFLERPN